MQDDELNALGTAASQGDQKALQEVLRRARPAVMAACSRIVWCQQDAEEACQDALMAVASKIATFDGRAQFTVWLRAVANNSALMTYRRLRAHAQRVQYPASLPDRADPRRTSVIAGTRIALLDAIEQLQVEDPDAAQPFLLREIGGLTYQEIVDYLGISLVNVKARIHRARKRIRAQLGDLRAG